MIAKESAPYARSYKEKAQTMTKDFDFTSYRNQLPLHRGGQTEQTLGKQISTEHVRQRFDEMRNASRPLPPLGPLGAAAAEPEFLQVEKVDTKTITTSEDVGSLQTMLESVTSFSIEGSIKKIDS